MGEDAGVGGGSLPGWGRRTPRSGKKTLVWGEEDAEVREVRVGVGESAAEVGEEDAASGQ